MTDAGNKAFDFAQSVAQQILTLATGTTALTLTFFAQFAKHPTTAAKTILIASWAVMAISILAGIGTLMTLTGNLEKSADPKIYSPNVQSMAKTQIIAFMLGILLTVIAGALAI